MGGGDTWEVENRTCVWGLCECVGCKSLNIKIVALSPLLLACVACCGGTQWLLLKVRSFWRLWIVAMLGGASECVSCC